MNPVERNRRRSRPRSRRHQRHRRCQAHADAARPIGQAVGNILCLHGASSLQEDDLAGLADDGFVKVNVYTTLAVRGGQAVANTVLEHLGDMYTSAQAEALPAEILAPTLLERLRVSGGKPKLQWVANPPRRDAWFAAVRDRCMDFLQAFHYANFAA